MIREAVADDMGRLLEMGQRFVAESEYASFISINTESLARTITNLSESPDGTVLVAEADDVPKGMIAMIVYDHPYSGERTAFELVWWMEPESRGNGLRLLRAAEDWARERGATSMQMVAPNERIGALYRRLGYQPVETSFQRSL